jgi:tetratricopeptide (TPR) repeat protein
MIRIKIKTLMLILASMILALVIAYNGLPSLLFNAGKYEAVLKLFPNDDKAGMALYYASGEALQMNDFGEDERLYIFPSFTSSSGRGTMKEARADAAARLEQLLDKYSTSKYINGVKFNLARLYMWDGQWDKAETLFRQLSQGPNAFYDVNELQSFLKTLESRHSEPDNHQKLSISGTVTLGDEPAPDVYVILHRKSDNGWSSSVNGQYPTAITDERGQYRFYDIAPDDYELGVGMTPEQVDGYYLTQSEQSYATIADDAQAVPRYDIAFVPQLKVVSPVNKERIDGDRLRFEWEAYPGADYYQISITTIARDKQGNAMGSTSSPLLDDRHRTTFAEYRMEELRGSINSYGKSIDANGFVRLWHSSILGVVYPGGDFIWSVDAYKADGRKLSSSSGYYTMLTYAAPFFTVSEEGMLEGDKLVMEDRYEEAIEAYKQDEDKDAALRALARLIGYGFDDKEGDLDEALRYVDKIVDPSDSDRQLQADFRKRLQQE